jgi:hypothetical protein
MKQTRQKRENLKHIILSAAGIFLFFMIQAVSYGQEDPPRPISVFIYPQQGLQFGALSQGASGGTVVISPTGSRSATGDVTLLNLGVPYSAALFGIEANPGTLITILNGPDATLTGSNGGTMTVHLGGSDPASPFVCTVPRPGRNMVQIGGTLNVGSPLASPPGSYSGTFTITFFQE